MTNQNDTSESAATDQPGQPDELSSWIVQQLKDAKKHSGGWRKDARECYDFHASRQWSEADKALLDEQKRPIVVFNRTARTVNSVCGLEVQNRQEVRYIPRELGDSGVNEVLTAAARWVRDNCDAEDEESESFQDMVISGMGWTETNLDYDVEQDGQIMIGRVDPLEMFWDPAAKKKNLADARWFARIKKVSKEEIRELWPDYASEDSKGEDWLEEKDQPHDASPPHYDGNSPAAGQKKDKELVQFQWWERETYYRAIDPSSGQIVEFDEDRYNVLTERLEKLGLGGSIQAVKQRRKVYKCAYLCGDSLLEEKPLEVQEGFTLRCMTGMRDRNSNTWFGLVCLMLDPQRWANKWLSQIMHILNSNSKGGLLAEKDAFASPKKAEDEWADPNAITWLNPGGLLKVKEKTISQMPTGVERLLQYAIESINDVPGVNAELLGLADRQQPGVLEGMRKQAGLTMLATLFDAKRRYTKEQGRILAAFIREYISDGRLIRIVGDEGAKYVPLLKDDVTFTYDVVVDEAPTSPNMKERVFGILTQLAPMLVKAGMPLPPEILEYLQLPESLIQKMKERMQPNPEQQAMQQAGGQIKLRQEAAKASKDEASAGLDVAKTDTERMNQAMPMGMPFMVQ
jgi:hypothetical protein